MGQTMSQLDHWASAANRATEAALGLQSLHDERTPEVQAFVQEWTAKRDELITALDELIRLQRVYADWRVPDNLDKGKVQEKLDRVASLDLVTQRDAVPNLKEMLDRLDDFDPLDVWNACNDAELVRPPAGYGRD